MADVVYSNNCDIFHMTNEETGEYDAKIDVHPGGTEYYSTNDDWDNHDHIHIDNDGNANECHGQEPRDWEDRTKA